MKRFIIGTIVLALMASVSMAGPTYTFSAAELASMVKAYDSTGATSGALLVTTTTYSDGVKVPTLAVGFEAQLHPGTPAANPYHPWAATGIGFPWVPAGPGGQSAPQGDLTGYTDYALTFYNDNDDAWSVNLYVNSGWTDAPYLESAPNGDYDEGGWVSLLPGQSTTVTMSLAGVSYLNHVSNIGFQIGANMDGANPNPSAPDTFHVSVSPIPAPGAILLAGMGAGLVGWIRRRRSL